MKTKAAAFLHPVWRLLTEVPGWPDAPLRQRLRRALPVLVPAAATLVLLGWQLFHHQPRTQQAVAAHQHLLDLEREVTELQSAYSEQQVQELAASVAGLRRQLPADRTEVSDILQSLDRTALHFGWIASAHASEPITDPSAGAEEPRAILLLPVRAKLLPVETNADPFHSLLSLLEALRTGPRRIDLMRLHISAEEGRWQAVELGLRLTLPAPHASAAE